MKYRDLITFQPIQSVKVLTEASALDQAKEDVHTFVISDRMLDLLRDVIVPNLRLDKPVDAKGIFIVANYGTGKTHLMSVISAVAEHTELLTEVTRGDAAETMQPLAGRYEVIRHEIGATTMSLRDIVCSRLETGLKQLGATYAFPPLSQVSGTKDSLQEMMAAFESVHPGSGLLFVLDELLDYLRGRKDAELNLDLRFLREVGEICRGTRFRIICGIQEALFDNPRFSHVASDINRVRDRFDQARISREDVAYVVQERLLKKTLAQKDEIRKHLQAFTPLYEGMAERLEDYVALFPVHPAYLRTFEQITAVEKREVLRTLSQEMAALLDLDVPDAPGLVCYDSYRVRLADDPSVRQIPEVREVLEKTDVLRNRVDKALATRQYVPVALRIIDGLAIHRLTTADIYAPIGALPAELRDDLCLLPPNLPEKDAFFLETTIKTVIDQIVKAVSGQFITENADNGQVYLDLRKDIDYDQRIEERAESLDYEKLDAAYFTSLEEVLERRDQPYVSGYRIWEYELPWPDHRVTRIGYLFLGAPNERSTAQPPRDFYIYFLQPYDPPKFVDEEKPDEVFFRLESPDEQFTSALRRYAGATALADESTAANRTVNQDKAKDALTRMTKWLRAHMGAAMTVTYRGAAKPLEEWLGASSGPRGTVKEQVETIAAGALTPYFDTRYPGYPKFGAEITKANVGQTVKNCLDRVATGRKTELSTKVLQSLGLLDLTGNSFTAEGALANALLSRLQTAGGKAVTRDDMLEQRDSAVWTWPPTHLEPIWLVVVASVLVQLGRAEIGFADGQVDALGLDRLAKMSVEELEEFTHIAPPKQLPLATLKEVAQLLGLPPGIVGDQGVDQAGVQQLLSRAQEMLDRVAKARDAVNAKSLIWGDLMIDQPDERDRRLDDLQKVLQNVRQRSSVGMMNKLDLKPGAIDAAKAGKQEREWVEAAVAARTHLDRPVGYLKEAVEVFGEGHALSKEALTIRQEVIALFRGQAAPAPPAVTEVKAKADELSKRFAEEAIRAHSRDRLDGPGDERKRKILEGSTYRELDALATVSILPNGVFENLRRQLIDVGTCKTFDEHKLYEAVICPECHYRPQPSSGPTALARIDAIEYQLDQLRENWVKALRESLREPELNSQIDYLDDPEEKIAVRALVDDGIVPEPVTPGFVKALNQLFKGFEVRKVTRDEMWDALFPEQSPATRPELMERLGGFLKALGNGASDDKVRIVPAEAPGE